MQTQQKEIWKDIPGYEGLYQVSNLGNVKSLDREVIRKDGRVYFFEGKILKKNKGTKGYLCVNLYKKSKKHFKIHKLVAMAFLNHTPCGYKIVVDHINNINTDNRVENLQLTSNRENASKDRNNTSSKYTGVSWSKSKNKWRSYITINNKLKHLGYFKDEELAKLAYIKELEILNKQK